jgi:hypothetical protein
VDRNVIYRQCKFDFMREFRGGALYELSAEQDGRQLELFESHGPKSLSDEG